MLEIAAQRLRPARVWRFYSGGALLARFRGGGEDDGPFPEDWICSVSEARNPGRDDLEAGLTRLEDGRLLRAAVEEDPEAWLGADHLAIFGPTPALLVKLLDSAERLPVHAHPDRSFAAEHLGSPFGKTEAWIVLATRADAAEVFVGLKETVTPETYGDWIERQNTEALLGTLNRLVVKPGDVVYVPAGVPHAIGAGALVAEVQEPTDFSILCEWQGFPIRPEDAHLGLGWETILDALDLRAHEPVRGLPDDARPFFFADDGTPAVGDRFSALLVGDGDGSIDGEPAQRGDVFAVPARAQPPSVEGNLRLLRFLGADPALSETIAP